MSPPFPNKDFTGRAICHVQSRGKEETALFLVEMEILKKLMLFGSPTS